MAFAALWLVAVATGATGQEGNAYSGSKACAGCHSAVTEGWAETRHAKAFESLKKSGKEGLPGCVGCHVTGYERPGGFIDEELTPELAGVQCEACHGPGRAHGTYPSKGSVLGKPGIDTCRSCHTPGQDPKFDYGRKSRGIHGAVRGDGRR